VAAVADVDEAVVDFGLLLQPAAEAEVTAAAAVTSAIVFREILIAPLFFDRVISNSDA
jgi:hypothetical protein